MTNWLTRLKHTIDDTRLSECLQRSCPHKQYRFPISGDHSGPSILTISRCIAKLKPLWIPDSMYYVSSCGLSSNSVAMLSTKVCHWLAWKHQSTMFCEIALRGFATAMPVAANIYKEIILQTFSLIKPSLNSRFNVLGILL